MERSKSVPVDDRMESNPFWSQKVQDECRLQASRPSALPVDGSWNERPDEAIAGGSVQFHQSSAESTGKGRGGAARDGSGTPFSTEHGSDEMRTEGRMPGCDGPVLSQGKVKSAGNSAEESSDGLQRALEGELVEFLRCQNSKLMQELECLKGQLQHVQVKAGSGDASSPWSAVNGTSVEGSSGNGTFPTERHGRGGSRTPRHRTRERAVSPGACEKGGLVRFTPNGTKVPEGPPPRDEPMLPPVPPFPTVAGEPLVEGTSFVSNLYDTCESKLRVKNGDVQWKPHDEKGNDAILSPQEAKQAWLEREVRSLKVALDRVAVPSTLTESGYWNPAGCNAHGKDVRHLHAGSGEAAQQVRAQHDGLQGGDRASQVHGDLCGQVRAWNGGLRGTVHGDVALQGRALHSTALGDDALRGAALGDDALRGAALGDGGAHHNRALHGTALGDLPGHDRALHGGAAELHGLPRDERLHGGATELHGLPRDERLHGGAAELHGLPRGERLHGGAAELHGLRRDGRLQWHEPLGVAPMPTSWESGGGGGGGKLELPMLPNGASPLEFGDWLCLCGPIMKDLSHVAGRWWDATVRQAYAFYMEWKGLSPLQRVQLCPRLPDELMASGFIRTEQRGVTLLLKAVSEEQQKELVVDRDLTSTAILFRLYVRHQPGGPGEKAILLGQLTSLQKASSMQELASSLRTWRRYFARAREVDASLPDGVLLIKALEAAVVQIAKEDSQAAFRLSTSRQQLALDQRPTEQSIWSFSQCLLAEAETLSLLKSSSTTTASVSTPVRLKQMDAEASNSPQKPGTPGNYGNKSGKGHSTPMSEQPCKFFKSDTGCKAGRSCKWSHSWEGIEDKNSRCWICGGKDHRKTECKVKGNGNNKPSSYDSGLGEDVVVEIKMQPTTKRLSSKLQLEKVMMV